VATRFLLAAALALLGIFYPTDLKKKKASCGACWAFACEQGTKNPLLALGARKNASKAIDCYSAPQTTVAIAGHPRLLMISGVRKTLYKRQFDHGAVLRRELPESGHELTAQLPTEDRRSKSNWIDS
jgi:hypothetical protein